MKYIKYSVILMFVNVCFSSVFAQSDLSLFESKILIKSQDTLPYRLLLPVNYNPQKKYPLILFLHGSGERGDDNEKQLIHGSDLFLNIKNRRKYPAIIVFPQCAKGANWATETFYKNDGRFKVKYSDTIVKHKQMDLLRGLIEYLKSNYAIDQKRLYVGGLSMGGRGAFELVHQNPTLFAAAFPICGGASPKIAKQLTTPNWWIFHGDADKVVLPEESIQMHKALLKEGAKTKLTLYPNVGHNSWENVFKEPKLLKWLFSNTL